MNKPESFEECFKRFVIGAGGEVLPEPCDIKVADYLFRSANVIAELKCLEIDQTNQMMEKLKRAVKKAVDEDPSLLEKYGDQQLVISTAPKAIADPWLEILATPLENIIRDANRQIRATKERYDLPSAKGLLLVFNEKNILHNRPTDFRLLTGKVLRKRTQDKELRFPHINGLVYFSYESVKSEREQMSFWAPLEVKHSADEDVSDMQNFQSDLRQQWYEFVAKETGKPVRQHEVESKPGKS